MDTKFTLLGIISVSADLITLLGLLIAIRFAILKRYENELAFKISIFLHYIIRTALIAVVLILLIYGTNYLYGRILILFKGDSSNHYWEKGKEIQHILSYLITYPIGLSIAWIITTFIWTSSFNLAKDFVNLFLPKNKMILKQNPILEISNAIYGTDQAKIDVTPILRQMVDKNKLIIRASNAIAGDPHYGVGKRLIINYKFGNKLKQVTINEGDIITIPEE